MNWLNLNVSTLDSPEFLGADPVQRAAWLCLLRYCAGQEDGGIIPGCAGWKDRQWQQVVRVTLEEVQQPCALYFWQGEDLAVAFYPLDKEQEVKGRRETAATNGRKGGRPRKEQAIPPMENPAETQPKPTLVISGKAEGERKEKEKDKENRNAPSSLVAVADKQAQMGETLILFPKLQSQLASSTAIDPTAAANAVSLSTRCSQDLQGLFREWQAYRTERATTGPKSKRLPWTAQAARMTARQIDAATAEHPERVVCDRIRAAIAGNWQGLNFDKLETGRPGGQARTAGTQSAVPGISNRRGAAL